MFIFESVEGDNDRVKNFKIHYSNKDYLANHFLIRSLQQNNIARQYTICNTMHPELYNSYLRALKPENDAQYQEFNRLLLKDKDSKMMAFCIKNYGVQTGLSYQIHSLNQNNDSFYEIKGPMGHGLRPKPKGLHIAFAAGTGVLCFVDFVASLIQDKLALHDSTISNITRRTQSSGSRNILMQALGDSIE